MILAWLALSFNARGQESIRPSDIHCHQGRKVQLPIVISNDGSLPIVGISFTLALPEGVTLVTDDDEPLYELNSDRLNPQLFTVFTRQDDSGAWVFRIITNSATAVLSGTEGKVMTLTLAVAENMAAGNYNISLTKNKLSVRKVGITIQSVPLADAASTLTVADAIMGM